MNTKEFIIDHHAADPTPGPQFAKEKAYHISQGWGDIGYHFFIERDGTLVEGRPLDQAGAHAVNCGCWTDRSGLAYSTLNYRSIGICLAGNLITQPPTKEQITTLYALHVRLQSHFGIPDSRVLLHREVKATSCPGADLRKALKNYEPEYLAMRLEQAQKAILRAKGARLTMLERLISRLLKLTP